MTPMSSECKTDSVTQVSLLVPAGSPGKFTTLLQSGIFIEATQNQNIGGLLAALPGFTEQYIAERLQTIFVNGLPADDLDQLLSGPETVLAISAAMPGLAGAIFRKGGMHASLRTTKKIQHEKTETDGTTTVRLKLFNAIAKERGEALLGAGCLMMASTLEKFLAYHPPLIASMQNIDINGQTTDAPGLLKTLADSDKIRLTIQESRDN